MQLQVAGLIDGQLKLRGMHPRRWASGVAGTWGVLMVHTGAIGSEVTAPHLRGGSQQSALTAERCCRTAGSCVLCSMSRAAVLPTTLCRDQHTIY
jgi:hypothetical protein